MDSHEPRDRRHSGGPSTGQPLRLLIVDDDPTDSAYVTALTRRLGFWVDSVSNGETALQRLAIAPFDIAIIDYEMPGMTGVETIARIRAEESLKSIYGIMLTGHEDIDTKLKALDAGFDDFLTKGSSEAEIVAKLIAAKRVAMRQRTMSVAMRDLYGLATRDDLTSVFNRRFFISECERLLTEGTIVNVVLLDLDGFKQVNDTYGHLAGDQVLKDVGIVLQSNTRSDDIVARFGGDEFVVAIPHLDVLTVSKIADRLATAIAGLQWNLGGTFHVGASAGFASSLLLEKATIAQLVNAADRDMYKNKWIRKHPEERFDLYEYPEGDRTLIRRLFKP